MRRWQSMAPIILAGCFLTITLAISSLAQAQQQSLKRFTNSLGMEFVRIPAGSFIMGSAATQPGRKWDEKETRVTISRPFFMQTTEVTVEQWHAVMGKRFMGRMQGAPNSPVVRVSWHDVMEFLQRLNAKGEGVYALPTEAQWEYACRAGTTTAYSWGNEPSCDLAMYANNPLKDDSCVPACQKRKISAGGAAPVKSYPPNPWGLYDMHGNVWEWCSDWYGEYGKGEVKDPAGLNSGNYKVRRGGSWYRDPVRMRSSNRNYAHPDSRYSTLGFRLIKLAD